MIQSRIKDSFIHSSGDKSHVFFIQVPVSIAMN
jgi:hypothetical protein